MGSDATPRTLCRWDTPTMLAMRVFTLEVMSDSYVADVPPNNCPCSQPCSLIYTYHISTGVPVLPLLTAYCWKCFFNQYLTCLVSTCQTSETSHFLSCKVVNSARASAMMLYCTCFRWAMSMKYRKDSNQEGDACDVVGVVRIALHTVWSLNENNRSD